jgi:hypothetical protein
MSFCALRTVSASIPPSIVGAPDSGIGSSPIAVYNLWLYLSEGPERLIMAVAGLEYTLTLLVV